MTPLQGDPSDNLPLTYVWEVPTASGLLLQLPTAPLPGQDGGTKSTGGCNHPDGSPCTYLGLEQACVRETLVGEMLLNDQVRGLAPHGLFVCVGFERLSIHFRACRARTPKLLLSPFFDSFDAQTNSAGAKILVLLAQHSATPEVTPENSSTLTKHKWE